MLCRWLFVVTLSCVPMLGCNLQGGKGVLEVQIKDHRLAIGDFLSAKITVESIRISPKVGFRFWQLGWIDMNPLVDQVDLTQYVDNSKAMIFKGDVESGWFEGFDLRLRGVAGISKKDSAPLPISNRLTPIALSFSVNPREVTTIILDLAVMDMSDHPPQAYELQIVGYEVYNNGKLTNKIPPG